MIYGRLLQFVVAAAKEVSMGAYDVTDLQDYGNVSEDCRKIFVGAGAAMTL